VLVIGTPGFMALLSLFFIASAATLVVMGNFKGAGLCAVLAALTWP
jgi:hypothetical protein